MRWTPGGVSSDIEDRRGSSGGGGFSFGRGPQVGCGGAIILLVLSLLTGRNFFSFFDGSSGSGGTTTAPTQTAAPTNEAPGEHQAVEFVSFVLNDTQNTWEKVLAEQNVQYRRSKLVLFRDSVDSACGFAQAATGPFYCPSDEKVYIDLAFYDELHRRFGAPGDFAQAYVIAHEIGHHVQDILGISEKVHRAQSEDRGNANEYSVRLELQADCYAGVWGHSTKERNILESGDVEEGLNAAAAIGDDKLQREAGRRVNPDSFTHGSSAQRVEWFRRGFESGKIEDCDTFQ
ncbi:MAG TPA: neutral zinc metallopeptidase [Thermoanaerobaculia bacterium]|nr:neutral zinc metallopeptidase [Thermoanaerobaculia bacterium]